MKPDYLQTLIDNVYATATELSRAMLRSDRYVSTLARTKQRPSRDALDNLVNDLRRRQQHDLADDLANDLATMQQPPVPALRLRVGKRARKHKGERQ